MKVLGAVVINNSRKNPPKYRVFEKIRKLDLEFQSLGFFETILLIRFGHTPSCLSRRSVFLPNFRRQKIKEIVQFWKEFAGNLGKNTQKWEDSECSGGSLMQHSAFALDFGILRRNSLKTLLKHDWKCDVWVATPGSSGTGDASIGWAGIWECEFCEILEFVRLEQLRHSIILYQLPIGAKSLFSAPNSY